jgi:hypothetical protein
MRGSSRRRLAGVALAVLWVMQHGVNTVEDVPPGDGALGIASAELLKDPVGDVLAAIDAVFRVGVEREPMRDRASTEEVQVWNDGDSGGAQTGMAASNWQACDWPTFLPSGMVAERSSPSRVR